MIKLITKIKEYTLKFIFGVECQLIRLLGLKRSKYLNKKLIKKQYYMANNKKLDENNPTTFDEKINWIKLNYYNPLYEKCTDKVQVRDYVKSKGLGHILTRFYGIYDNVLELDFDKIPNKCVIKTNHSSGCVFVINDKNNIDKKKIIKKLKKDLKRNFYIKCGEWQYKNIKPKIIVEELIESDDSLVDYKLFCFDGKVRLIYVAKNVSITKNYTVDFYDPEWNYLDITRHGHKLNGYIKKPDKLGEMIKIAEILSKDFVHVRVDLYCEKEKIYFGELTFTTGAGYTRHGNEELLTKYFDITKLKNN